MKWRDIPSLSALRALESAIRLGGFTKAAAELNVTQAAIAQHVRKLEDDFGEPLVQRAGKGIEGTEAGRALAARLREGFEVIHAGVSDLRTRHVDRPLNIALTPKFASNWLMPRIGDFWAKHSDIPLNLQPSSDVVNLRAQNMDIAIRYGTGPWAGLNSEPLTQPEFWIVAAPSMVSKTHQGLSDVMTLPWILDPFMRERDVSLAEAGVNRDDLHVTYLNTNDLVLSAVIQGLGVTVQDKALVETAVTSGQLVKICALPSDDHRYHILTVPGRAHPGQAPFIRWLKEQAAE